MAQDFIPVLFQLILAIVVGAGLVLLSHILGPRKKSKIKDDTYECGVDYFGDARKYLNVKYYIVAILFILFDIEIVFLFPWAVVYRKIGIIGIVEMFIFLFILVIGLIYAWKKGALEWE